MYKKSPIATTLTLILSGLVITPTADATGSASWKERLFDPLIHSQYSKKALIAATAALTLWSFWPTQAYTYWKWDPDYFANSHPDSIDKWVGDALINSTINHYYSYLPHHLYISEKSTHEPFLFGASGSSIQVDNGHTATSGAWGQMIQKDRENGKLDRVLPGVACDAQNRYKEDVQLLKNINANAYRFSTSWSLVQPNDPKSWDQNVLNYYVKLCDELVANGIRPVITLHHYDDPIWFLEDLKGFETEAGIQAYVKYVEKIYDTLKDHGVHLWFTFNAPAAYAIRGYMIGDRPPAIKGGTLAIPRVRRIIYNMLEAHKRAYNAIHAHDLLYQDDPTIQKPRVGILKNIYQVDPMIHQYGPLRFALLSSKIGAYAANLLQDSFEYSFFANNPKCLDFIGLNYYSHGFIKNFSTPVPDPLELTTNNPQNTVSAEGMYRALHTLWDTVAKPLNIPIYVTENGIAAGDDDALRSTFMKRYLYAITQAIGDGIDVRGYLCWSLMDNYEWGVYNKCYGLYAVDRSLDEQGNPKLTRTLRQGAQPFVDAARNYSIGYEARKSVSAVPYWLPSQQSHGAALRSKS